MCRRQESLGSGLPRSDCRQPQLHEVFARSFASARARRFRRPPTCFALLGPLQSAAEAVRAIFKEGRRPKHILGGVSRNRRHERQVPQGVCRKEKAFRSQFMVPNDPFHNAVSFRTATADEAPLPVPLVAVGTSAGAESRALVYHHVCVCVKNTKIS